MGVSSWRKITEREKVETVTWLISDGRKDKRTGALSPVTRSTYAQYLFEKGAGFNERKTD